MELRVLQYFLAVAREESISGAAKVLHLSQPTLSRQLRDMEEELGKPLFIRGSRRIMLTEEGMLLRKRAEEIMELVGKARREIALPDALIAGDITVGAGETAGVRFLTQAVRALQENYPDIHLHIVSGDRRAVTEGLDKGLIDLGFIFGEVDTGKYEYLKVPAADRYGVLMRRDDLLASREAVAPKELWDKPLIPSRQMLQDPEFPRLLGRALENLKIVGSYSLLYNGSIMVDEGMGYAICLDGIINTSGDSSLCFRPLFPEIRAEMHIIWKKDQVFPKATEKLLWKLQQLSE